MIKKNLTDIIIIAIVIVLMIGLFAKRGDDGLFGAVAYQTAPSFYVASSTSFTLTTSSQRLLATSTPTKRLAATIQPVNCTAGQPIFLRANNDVVATANTGIAVYASSTMAFEDYPGTPVVQGSVQGITGVGTCTVLVTEWRSQY